MFCVLHPIGAQFLQMFRRLGRDVSKRFAYPGRSRQYQPIDALGMLDGERLRDQAAERPAPDMRFLDAEGLDQRGSIVTHILERIGLPRIACVAGITLVISDDGEALFKLGGEAAQTSNGRLPHRASARSADPFRFARRRWLCRWLPTDSWRLIPSMSFVSVVCYRPPVERQK